MCNFADLHAASVVADIGRVFWYRSIVNFWKRLFDSSSQPQATDPGTSGGRRTPKIHTTVIICDYPKFLIGIEDDVLAFLVRDALGSTDDVSVETVIRYLAGALGSDVERVLRPPVKRHLTVSGTSAVTFEFDYLVHTDFIQFSSALTGLVSESWRKRIGECASAATNRTKLC